MSALKSVFSNFNTSTTSFLLSAYFLIMSWLGFGHPFIVDETEPYKTESLIVDLNIYGPWFMFFLIKGWDLEILEDTSKKKIIRKRRSPILFGIDHLMNNEIR
ncbi:hypothetical protein PanWU01x14_337720 [Parasponia andersonii]|uniref:Uncharacterized protein n=1 Tax=Parasponia andersonii TaxID=3476 RepID=A0A2P5AFF3_PARAD|nr:hypothetical protein PanWU01x14_337720 [Parasponia andersonii]